MRKVLFVSVLELGQSHWPRVTAAGFVKTTFVSLVSLVLAMGDIGSVEGVRESVVVAIKCWRRM